MIIGVGASAVGPIDSFDGAIEPPITAPPSLLGLLGFVETTYLPVVLVLGSLAMVSLVVRFRRGGDVERQQLKWFGLANATFITVIAIAVLTLIEPMFVVALFAAAGIPVSAGIAILRYRLFDIDRIISRSIGWAVVTGVLSAVFIGGVLALQAMLTDMTQGETLAVAASTLAAAALFQPLRRHVQRAVDRRFERSHYNSQQTTNAFVNDVHNEVDLSRLRAKLANTAGNAVRPTSASVWLRGSEEA